MDKVCDIILLSYESPALLKDCVESVLLRTNVPSRLIIVDNASKDTEVARYLSGVRSRGNIEVEKVFNKLNLGFAAGTNVGLRMTRAPFVCLLNNDCVVTDGWLEQMIAVANSGEDIGLVNPQSNTFGSRPAEGISIDEYAAILSDRKGNYVELGHIIGFACLIKRKVLEKIGLLDEVYEGVCYEDTDFALKAQKAGFISVMAEAAYVYHKEQASRKKLKNKEAVYARNKVIFEKRWGKLLRVMCLEESAAGVEATGASYEALKGLARQRAIVDMWVTGHGDPAKPARDVFFGSMKHADISAKRIRGRFSGFKVLWKVLTKKKKYDAVILKEGQLAFILGVLKPAHGAEILVRKSRTRLIGADGNEFDLDNAGVLARHLRTRGDLSVK